MHVQQHQMHVYMSTYAHHHHARATGNGHGKMGGWRACCATCNPEMNGKWGVLEPVPGDSGLGGGKDGVAGEALRSGIQIRPPARGGLSHSRVFPALNSPLVILVPASTEMRFVSIVLFVRLHSHLGPTPGNLLCRGSCTESGFRLLCKACHHVDTREQEGSARQDH
jgi:hypothetical protein